MENRRDPQNPPRPNMIWSDKHKLWMDPDTRSPERRRKDEAVVRRVDKEMAISNAVQVGQMWAANDPRAKGRTIQVKKIEPPHAICKIVTNRDGWDKEAWKTKSMIGREVKIKLRRFTPTSSGYKLLGCT